MVGRERVGAANKMPSITAERSELNGNAALSAEMALRIEKAFGVKMETLLNMQAWHDAYAMRQREGEIAVKPYRPSALEPH
jgi:plasmid maintenance system antidote protein VapI